MKRIGIYPGSFSPFHQGHWNILDKATKLFDEVIVAKGINPEKQKLDMKLPNIVLSNFKCREYSGLLTDFISEISNEYNNFLISPPTVIRGLRNNVDLQYELNQYRYFQDLMPDIQLISIFCDKEYEHISSSGIRLLTQYGEDKVEKYLV
jgi:pantetheine-phosphate adenylyltransferase